MSKKFDDRTIEELQKIRRASNAITACIEILNEHSIMKECVPVGPGPCILLNAQQEGGLIHAIEACSRSIDETFDEDLEKLGVGCNNEWMPKKRKEAEAHMAMQRGEISYDEYSKVVDIGR